MKSIYTYYKERLIEISGKNRSLYSKKISKKYAFDLGKIFDGDYETINAFVEFLWREKRYSFPIIKAEDKDRLYKNLGIEKKLDKNYQELEKLEGKEKSAASLKLSRLRREETKKAISSQITSIKNLKREIEEFEKETGRYELYIGYPFVQGSISKDMLIKAPLLLFPIVIDIVDENTVEVAIKRDEAIQFNKVFCVAYAQQHKLNLEEMELEFKGGLNTRFKNVAEIIDYMRKFGFKIGYTARKGMFDFERSKEPSINEPLEVKNYCVMGRFPLANSIYNDYTLLEKQKLTNEAIDELLYAKTPKKSKKTDERLFFVSNLDYAQENAIQNLNNSGNIVIYGPPGTGKSQTIVNVIADSICKHKRVLVVSQKKAALDVVYNRLGSLNEKVMFLVDPEKSRQNFYERAKQAHENTINFTPTANENRYAEIGNQIKTETAELETISNTLFNKTNFGLSLQEMYANSNIIGKNSYDYTIYQNLINSNELLKLDYPTLSDNLRLIKEKNKAELYYKFTESKKSNPFVDCLKDDVDLHTINQSKSKLNKLLNAKVVPFDFSQYPNSRQLISYYVDKKLDINELKPLAKFVAKEANPNAYKTLQASYVFLPMLPFAKSKTKSTEREIEEEFERTIIAIKEYTREYEFLREVLTDTGYANLINYILNGNSSYLKLLYNALDNYVEFRDLNLTLTQLTDAEHTILDFAYKNTDTKARYLDTINKLLTIRIYYEVTKIENEKTEELAKTIDYENLKNRIISLKTEQNLVSRAICMDSFKNDYVSLFNKSAENKNYLYQINKQQKQWPIRKFMEVYSEFMFNLFPCWLLSPESACTILPLTKNLFDIVIFDEASQIFIENTLPIIFRGKNIVIAGDSKQLRPTAMFMKRYLGSDIDEEMDYSTQAALEVESLLDLAMTRYTSAHLTYHYRSKNEELINFSNYLFYDGKLQIAPNTTKNVGKKPIQRIKVEGKWLNRCNEVEAKAVVDILKKVFSTRKNKQSIGVITFNSEQESAIEDAIDAECTKNPRFREQILKERNRKENGEDISLFVKNLENVQGDERDIIIFSIGYAQNEFGKVVAHFGPLSVEGGENRLNVAITRAKEKIYVVTSIEPEELNVEGTKNLGPKIFKNYLRYVRAISNSKQTEAKIILDSCTTLSPTQNKKIVTNNLEDKIKIELEKLGFKVETNVGNADYKISLGVYDKKLDKFLVGVECDYSAFKSSPSILERDVQRPTFLKSRGWDLIRIWSRDWWLHKQKVINLIVKIANKNKDKLTASLNKEQKSPTPRSKLITIKTTN